MSEIDYWQKVHGEQTLELQRLAPYPGCFVQLRDWYEDVWGEVVSVYSSSVTMCFMTDRPEIRFMHEIRSKVVDLPPPDARIVYAIRHGRVVRLEPTDGNDIRSIVRMIRVSEVLSA